MIKIEKFTIFLTLGAYPQTTDDGVELLADSVVECNGWLHHCTFLLRPLFQEEKIANSEVLVEDQYKNVDRNHRKWLTSCMHI